jgi:hypothetical protein
MLDLSQAEPIMSDDDRPRKSWREIDKAKDRSVHRKEERRDPQGRPMGQRRQKSYRASLDRLFDSGKISELVEQQAPGTARAAGGEQSRLKQQARIRDASGRDEVTEAVDAYLERYPMPDDFELLTRILEHRDPGRQLEAMNRLGALLEQERPKRTRALLGQLKMIRDLGEDPELEQLAERLIEMI